MSGLTLRAAVADRGLDIEYEVAPGEVLAVLGANGSGKSTTLHVTAGLLRPDTGVVRVGTRTLTDTDAGVQVPTHARRVGLLLQDPLLFPHLDVSANVAFAARQRRGRGPGRGAARAAAQRWLAEVDAAGLADRRPRQLSGGQAQRVAIARALAGEPDVLLLDEPLAGLDVAAAAAVRRVLRRVVADRGRSAVLVTHDVLDVLTLADRVVVLDGGRVVEQGTATQVLATPRSDFAARIAGVNLVRGTVEADGVLRAADGRRWYGRPAEGVEVGAAGVALFAPSAVAVYRDEPHGSPRNVAAVTVAELDVAGPTIRVRSEVQADGSPGVAADVTAVAAADLDLGPGSPVWFVVKAQEIAIHAAHR